MNPETLAQFDHQQYLNLERFKRDGTPVQTPVWFAEDLSSRYLTTPQARAQTYRIAACSTDCSGRMLSMGLSWMAVFLRYRRRCREEAVQI